MPESVTCSEHRVGAGSPDGRAPNPFVDYHFHPNFRVPALWRTKSSRIWEGFRLTGLDAVVVCEHSYKNPVESFQALARTRPQGHGTVLLPGVEVLTREGLDVVVFGHDEAWYGMPDLRRLLTPYGPTIQEVISILRRTEHLAGYLPHPFTCGTTGTIKRFGIEGTRQLAAQIGGVEASNNSFNDSIHISERVGGHLWFPNFHGRMQATQQLQGDFMDGLDVGFFAVGSDAHFPEELGHGVELNCPGRLPTDGADAFDLMRSNRVHTGTSTGRKLLASRIFHCSKSALITGDEFLQKMRIRTSLRRRDRAVPGRVMARM